MSKTVKRPIATKKKVPLKHTASGVRQLQLPKRILYKPLTWRHSLPVPTYKPLSKARHLFVATLCQLWRHKRLFGGITVIYGMLNLILVRGLSGSSDLGALKSTFDSVANGVQDKLVSSLASFGYLLTTSGSGNAANSSAYQSIVLLLCSLAFVWALRQVLAKHTVRVRDSFYQGMYPLIPFFLVFMMFGVQLLPLVLGGGAYQLLVTNGVAVHLWEKALALVVCISLALWSLRMVTATIFALYIVMLPDMTPMRALRSAKRLVYGRRLMIWRKLIFLPVCMVLLAIVVELPLILFVTPVASWTFFALTMVALPVTHSYLYGLYRELL